MGVWVCVGVCERCATAVRRPRGGFTVSPRLESGPGSGHLAPAPSPRVLGSECPPGTARLPRTTRVHFPEKRH